MKNMTLLFLCIVYFQAAQAFTSNFYLSTNTPQAGERVTVTYDHSNTVLAQEEVFGIVYFLELGESPVAQDLILSKSEKGYTANITIPNHAQVLYFKFTNEDGEIVDTNEGEGYYTYLYQGEKPQAEAPIVASSIYAGNADLFGLKLNGAKAMEIFEQGITDPAQRIHFDYLNNYAVIVRVLDDAEGKEAILTHINYLLDQGNSSEEEMKTLASVARRIRENDLYESIMEQVKTTFPEGADAVAAKYANFRQLGELAEQVAMYEEAYSKYQSLEGVEGLLDNMERRIADAYGKQGDFENMYKYAQRLSNVKSQAGLYNKYAWECSGGSLEEEGKHVDQGLAMSKKSLELIERDMKTLADKYPAYSDREWTRGLKSYYGAYSDTYALLAYKNDKKAEALQYQKIACESAHMEDATMNARFALFLEEENGATAALDFLEEMIAEGYANEEMKASFTRLFQANLSVEQASERYLAYLEKQAKATKLERIKEEMINEEAPAFALKNLAGESVSLESLQGKVVVIDFWATWCGPCKASFPAMQEAVNKYEETEDVAFLFIDTWERSSDKQAGAQAFISDNGYTFEILMDNDNKAVSDFGVRGIPAKFILDKQGHIRFNGAGFDGNNQALVDEISTVVEILRNE
ncbi:MAG: TlpA disulfide reductase family protein [Bacteroidota bacterium]